MSLRHDLRWQSARLKCEKIALDCIVLIFSCFWQFCVLTNLEISFCNGIVESVLTQSVDRHGKSGCSTVVLWSSQRGVSWVGNLNQNSRFFLEAYQGLHIALCWKRVDHSNDHWRSYLPWSPTVSWTLIRAVISDEENECSTESVVMICEHVRRPLWCFGIASMNYCRLFRRPQSNGFCWGTAFDCLQSFPKITLQIIRFIWNPFWT